MTREIKRVQSEIYSPRCLSKSMILKDGIFKNDDDYFEEIEDGLWLMDNHKWAFVIWNENRHASATYKLIHVDYHWDAGYDYGNFPEEEKIFLAASNDGIREIVKEENWIRYDSFICPAIAKGFIDEIHFFCLQDDRDGDIAIYEGLAEKYQYTQILHEDHLSLSNIKADKPIIFDFCIDIFNHSDDTYYEGAIWEEKEIDALLVACKKLVQQAELVTVSMSYGFSGKKEDTERLTRKIFELFSTWRNKA